MNPLSKRAISLIAKGSRAASALNISSPETLDLETRMADSMVGQMARLINVNRGGSVHEQFKKYLSEKGFTPSEIETATAGITMLCEFSFGNRVVASQIYAGARSNRA